MKANLLITAALLSLGTVPTYAQVDSNGYTTVNATMGTQYSNRVFFDLSANELNTQPANNWDVAFYRNATMDMGIRINDAMNVETYQISNDPTQWDAITTNATSGTPMYNPDNTERLQDGVFSLGTPGCSNPAFAMGFGCYNIGTHHVDGKVIYLLKYPDNNFIKFMITDYYGGYIFKYAKWNGSSWGATTTQTIANGTADAYFNYYSFTTDSVVTNNEPPKNNWELMFTRYWNFYNNIMMYRLSGIVQSPRISVAKTTETQNIPGATLPAATEFKKEITTIGHSWKGANAGSLVADRVYYIKEGSTYYRLFFVENGGSANGNMHFKYKDISSVLSTSDIKTDVSFGMYPNPAPNKTVTLLYDVKTEQSNKGQIQIFDLSGRKVYETEITKSAGFFKKELQLHSLSSGTYLVNLKVGSHSETKKLILK